jgi:regulator of protease activity HflC (stomatin/prohibitin superfamily)
MKKILVSLGKLIGIYFVEENYVAPVFRFGMYRRVCGPGFFLAIPILENVGQPVKSGIHFTSLKVSGALSSDSIPIDIELQILFRFDPEQTQHRIAAQLVRVPEYVLTDIAEDYADSFLRRVVANFTAEDICSGKAVVRIQRQLSHILADRLGFLGYVVGLDSGVLIKGITASPKFQQTMLDAKRYEVTLRVLNAYQAADVDQALFAELVNGLAKGDGSIQFLSLADAMNFPKSVRGNGN